MWINMTDRRANRIKYEFDKPFKEESESVYDSLDNMKMSEEITPEDAHSLCRVCLAADRKDLVPMRTTEDSSLADIFTVLTSIKIQEDDVTDVPTLVCELCRLDLEHFYQFRDKCIKSDSIIKSLLERDLSVRNSLEVGYEIDLKSTIKEEDAEVTDVQYLEDVDLNYYEEQYILEDREAGNKDTTKPVLSETETKVVSQNKTKKSNHYCTICNKKFKKVKTLRFHVKQKHERKADPFACGQCSESFMSQHDLGLHETVHAKGPVWKCIKCQKEFNSRTVYRRHVRRHMAFKRHACERCGKAFVERHALRRHLRVHSGQPPPRAHACHLCDKRYADSSLLASHMLRHSGVRPCACGTCGKTFPSPRLLASHALVHSEDKPHACRVCERRFRHESTLRTHLRTHTGERPYVCASCGKAFIQNSNLTLHMRTHTGERPYSCEVCARSFSSGSTLKSHLRTHTGEKPYGCEVCGKRFARLGLRAHMRLHSGERPFACSACARAFHTAARLREHVRLHTGEKPYECAMCPQKYATKSHLAKHLKSHDPKRKNKVDASKVVILQHIEENRPYDEKVVYAEIETLNGDIHKDIGEQVPLEVTGELVLQENGEVKTELVMVEGETGGNICLTTDGVNFVNNDVSYGNNVNLVTVNDGEVIAAAERGVKLYQLDHSLVQIHSAGGQVTISQITSKMTANF